MALGVLTAHKGNASGEIHSNYWPDKDGQQPALKSNHLSREGDNTHDTADTIINDIEALKMLWIKDDTSWNTAEVFWEHRKKLRPFSEDYKYRKTKLLGHVIRAKTATQ